MNTSDGNERTEHPEDAAPDEIRDETQDETRDEARDGERAQSADGVREAFLKRHEELIVRTRAGRFSLLLISVAGLINLILLLAASNTVLAFTMTIPNLAVIYSGRLTASSGNALYGGMLIALAVLILAVMFAIWRVSMRHTAPIAVFLGIYIVDTVLLFVTLGANIPFYLIDCAYHGWALYAIIRLFLRRLRLNRLWREETGEEGEWPADMRPVYGAMPR